MTAQERYWEAVDLCLLPVAVPVLEHGTECRGLAAQGMGFANAHAFEMAYSIDPRDRAQAALSAVAQTRKMIYAQFEEIFPQ